MFTSSPFDLRFRKGYGRHNSSGPRVHRTTGIVRGSLKGGKRK